jgi:hypothetical protein
MTQLLIGGIRPPELRGPVLVIIAIMSAVVRRSPRLAAARATADIPELPLSPNKFALLSVTMSAFSIKILIKYEY